MFNWECDCNNECNYALWSPYECDTKESQYVEDRAFSCYAMECEGDLPTRQGKINKVIKILADSTNPNDFRTQCMAYDEAGLNSDTLSNAEIEYMEKEIARRF